MRIIRRLRIAAVAALAVVSIAAATARPAAAMLPVIDLNSLIKEATMIQNQLQQITQLKQQITLAQQNVQGLPTMVWAQAQQSLDALAAIVNQGQSVSVTDAQLGQEFQNLYPSYVAPANFADAYNVWAGNTRASALATLKAAGVILNGQNADLATTLQDEQHARTATGQLAAAQAGAEIAAQQVEQLQKLLSLEAIQRSSEQSYYMQTTAVQQEQVNKESALSSWLLGSPKNGPGQ
ncbi:hypothetical protein EPN42_13110 [bacterium]|nr:MAG: hypothetical protein EPN42_13110 [bacterium]